MHKKRKQIIVAIVIVLVIAAVIAGVYYYKFNYPKYDQEKEIKIFKQKFYKSIICQYNCPLSSQEYQNKTQMLPSIDCLKDCSNNFLKETNNKTYSEQLLIKDDLLKDIEQGIITCKKQAAIKSPTNSSEIAAINTTLFFSCSGEKLSYLKNKYDYL